MASGGQDRSDSGSAEARQLFAGAPVSENVPLAPLTTLRIGPVARRLITCATTEQVVDVLRELDADPPGQVLVLAGGSNLVIADELPDLTVVRLANAAVEIDGYTLRAEAGAVWDDVVGAAGQAGTAQVPSGRNSSPRYRSARSPGRPTPGRGRYPRVP